MDKFLIKTVIICCIFGIVACQKSNENLSTGSEVKNIVFGDIYVRNSLLNTIDQQAGSLDVCMGYVAWPQSYAQSGNLAQFKNAVNNSITKWVATLNENPTWKYKSTTGLKINFTEEYNGVCRYDNPKKLIVNVYNGDEKFFCNGPNIVKASNGSCVPQGNVQSRVLSLGFWHMGNPLSQQAIENVIMHEIGHFMGLADSYNEYNANGNWPFSVMTRPWDSVILSDIDAMAMWAVWEYLQGRSRNCNTFLQSYKSIRNIFNASIIDSSRPWSEYVCGTKVGTPIIAAIPPYRMEGIVPLPNAPAANPAPGPAVPPK